MTIPSPATPGPPLSAAALKQVKNSIIGNPLAKARLVQDPTFVAALLECLNPPSQENPVVVTEKVAQDALRTEAAHVVASLAYGSDPALHTLLLNNAAYRLLFALSTCLPSASTVALRTAFARALRVLGTAAADVVGPPLWGLRPEGQASLRGPLRAEAGRVLDYLVQADALDVYLPLLSLPSTTSQSTPALATAAAQLLAATLRSAPHRNLITAWRPLAERAKDTSATKTKDGGKLARRGWEKPALLPGGAGVGQGPWAIRALLALIGTGEGAKEGARESKLVEATLNALAALARENPPVATFLGKASPDRDPPPLSIILTFTKSRSIDVQLAACLCVTHILRASPPTPPPSGPLHPHISSHGHGHGHSHSHSHSHSTSHASSSSYGHHTSSTGGTRYDSGRNEGGISAHAHSFVHVPAAQAAAQLEEGATRTVMNVINRILSDKSTGVHTGQMDQPGQAGVGQVEAKTRACYVLNYLVSDDAALCHLALDRGCVAHVGALVRKITPAGALGRSGTPTGPFGRSNAPRSGTPVGALGRSTPGSDQRGPGNDWELWEEGESEGVMCLREASLTLLASLALHSDDIRRTISSPSMASSSSNSSSSTPNNTSSTSLGNSSASNTSSNNTSLLPSIALGLRARRHTGTRVAACQCVRALSRSVSVLRTSVVDSGLGMDILGVVMGWGAGRGQGGGQARDPWAKDKGRTIMGRNEDKAREVDDVSGADAMNTDVGEGTGALWLGEDRRVLCAALAAVCNIVNDFSPLKPIYLEESLMPRLVRIIRCTDDAPLRLNALWAVKNLVRQTSAETKRDIMNHLGWSELHYFLGDCDPDIQEQAFNILRNLAENEEGVSMVFRSLDPSALLSALTEALRSPAPDVVLQAANALANLANGTHEQQEGILLHPGLLSALQTCLAEAGVEIRRPAVSCVLVLAKGNPRRRREMREAGIVGTLKRLCEWSGHGAHAGHSHGAFGTSVSPTASGGHWGGRSPIATGGGGNVSASGVGGGTYGSWGGSGSLHAHATAHSLAGGAGVGANGSWGTASMGFLEDDRDVVARARLALDWLEHGETYHAS